MRLGDYLVKAGKLTQADVEETLKGQAIFGGRFGTNLVEMGYLDEHDLAHFLSKMTGVPAATPEQLMEVPPQITRLIPEEAVRKYNVMPVALNNRKLTVAMTDPTDFATIDELSFLTGYIVVPLVTPELRLVSALERHYNIRREMRYIRVEGGGRGRARQQQSAAQELAKQAIPASPAKTAMPSTPAAAPSPAATGAFGAVGSAALAEEEIIELPLLCEIDSFSDADSAPLAADTLLGTSLFGGRVEEDYGLEATLRGLTDAEDRNAIANLLVNHTAQTFHRSALFLVKGGRATGWVAKVDKQPVTKFDLLEVPLSDPSVLKVVAESKTYYLGPLPVNHYNSRINTILGGGSMMNNLLVPLIMMGRVVAILYVQGDAVRPEQHLPELQQLLVKASMAFEILILKSKIMLT